MMASHRPAEPPPEPLPSPNEAAPTPQPAGTPGTSTLPVSNFLVGFDWLLALGVLALAFLVASFSVRNSDFWMHLASGRLLSNGGYAFGNDPFSYVGADRIWVNHSWLYDWLLYKVFSSADGPGVVIAKAIMVTIAAGLLLIARRPGSSVFPGVVCVGLALVAAAPRMVLQPTIASLLCLAALMAWLIRLPKLAGSWRFPIAIGVLFMLWSNLDQWFFLGPVFLALYTVGHFIRAQDGDDRITLLKALGIGVLSCMLNPHHVRIWELPPELIDGELKKLVANDVEFGRLFRDVSSKGGFDFAGERENPLNLYSLFGLLALNLAGFVVNYRRLSIGLALIWLGGIALALLHLRAVPFLAFVAAPIAAMDLAAAGERLAARTMPGKTVRALHALRSGGRAAVGLAGLILIAISFAGWLHPFYEQRRWKWEVEPSLSMKQAAEYIQSQRDAGTLPPEARLLNFQPDFANYVAWFAPSEKSYCDYRFRFHREEMSDYIAMKQFLTIINARERRASSFDFQDFLRRHGIAYAVSAHPSRIHNAVALEATLGDIRNPGHGPEWALWHVAGRSVIMGWTRQTTISTSTFDRLRFDPIREVATNTERLPVPDIHQPLVARDMWDSYVARPPVSPAAGEESMVLLTYRGTQIALDELRFRTAMGGVRLIAHDRLLTPALNRWTMLDLRAPPTRDAQATALLAVRAARRAIVSSPDHPEGYYHLANAYPTYASADFNQEVAILVTTATLARCRARLPEDPSKHQTSVEVVEVCDRLADAHFGAAPPRIDMGLDVFKMATEYLRYQTDQNEANLDRVDGEQRAAFERRIEADRRVLAERDRRIKELESLLRKNRENYINTVASVTSPIERAAVARRYGLIRDAIEELYKTHAALQQQPQTEADKRKMSPADSARRLAEHAELIELMLHDGRVEEASQILDSVDTQENLAIMESDALLRGEYFAIRRQYTMRLGMDPRNPVTARFDSDPASHYRALRQGVSMITGDFKAATDVQVHDVQAVRKQIDDFRAQYFPGTLAPISALPGAFDRDLDRFYRPLFAPLNPVGAMLAGHARLIHVFRVEQLLGLVQMRVELHARLGLTFLEWGDVRSAAHHFRQATESPEMTATLQAQLTAREYLKLLEVTPGQTKKGP